MVSFSSYSPTTMVSLSTIFSALRNYDGLLEACSHRQLDLFIRLARHIRPEIEFHSPVHSKDPPYSLPRYLIIFLSSVLGLDTSVLNQLWHALKGFIWAYNDGSGDFEAAQLSPSEIEAINYSGAQSLRMQEKLGRLSQLISLIYFLNLSEASTMFYPPTRRCIKCKEQLPWPTLIRVPVTYYTASSGLDATQGYSSSLKCRGN